MSGALPDEEATEPQFPSPSSGTLVCCADNLLRVCQDGAESRAGGEVAPRRKWAEENHDWATARLIAIYDCWLSNSLSSFLQVCWQEVSRQGQENCANLVKL